MIDLQLHDKINFFLNKSHSVISSYLADEMNKKPFKLSFSSKLNKKINRLFSNTSREIEDKEYRDYKEEMASIIIDD